MEQERHVARGIVAGLAAGLVASWVMNEFMAGPGQKLQQAVQTPEENERAAIQSDEPKEDATMKTADAIASTVTGGQHLTWEEKQKSGPMVHYAFGGLMGALYGALAELWPGVRAGFGTTYGSVLFTGADLIAVPILNLGPSPTDQPAAAQTSPLAAHLVYGLTTADITWDLASATTVGEDSTSS
jgi:putative membrane protein